MNFKMGGTKFIYTVRWKFIYAFALSVLSGGLLLYAGYRMVQSLLYTNPWPSNSPYTRMLRWIINHFGSTSVMTAVGIFSFLLFFFIYSRKIILYLEEITRGITELASEGMSRRIEVRTGDELGVVALTINSLAERLERSWEEERSAVRAKNDLITGVSHDLRTPLTSILGFLEYIEQDRCQDEVEMRYYTGIAYEKSLVLQKLIDDLFEYTRVSGGGPQRIMERIDLSALVRQLAVESGPLLERAGMKMVLTGDEGPCWIKAAPLDLVRTFENLIANAAKYGSAGGRLEIGIIREPANVSVRVSNFGEMIAAADLPHVFERFYRADKSRSRQEGGSGLGLAIAKSITEMHGGTISAVSNPERTDFIVTLPLLSD